MKASRCNLILKAFSVVIACLLISTLAEAATNFYVDPDYTGSTKNGAASTPWNSLGTWRSSQWSTINSALASGNVTVYFSCKHYSNAANETTTTQLSVCRTAGTGTYRLTLDGNSYYSTSTTSPTWVANPGTYKFQINSSYPIEQTCSAGYGNCGTTNNQDKITVKGFYFNTTSGGNNFINGINEFVFTYNTVRGPFYIGYGNTGGINTDNGGVSDIEISYGDFSTQNLNDEALYIGACGYGYTTGCHDNVKIHHNTVHDGTGGSGQQDGIDIKSGITSLKVYNNTVYSMTCDGIVSLSSGEFYNNISHNNGYGGITFDSGWGAFKEETKIYNNAVYNNSGGDSRSGIEVLESSGTIGTVRIYNNSLYGNGSGNMSIVGPAAVYLKNNVTQAGTGSQCFGSGIGTLYSATNNFYGTSSGCGTSLNQNPIYVSVKGTIDLSLQASSPCINAGTDLTSEGGLSTDYLGYTRPSGAWDIGAYEYGADAAPPAAPRNLKIIN